jgi:hypothetical protein
MQKQSPFATSRALRCAFALGIAAIPFDAVRGVPALGELGNEASFPLLALAIAIAAFTALRSGSTAFSASLALKIGAGILAVILLSWAANAGAIEAAMMRDRSGGNKFATSLLVIVYGIGVAWLCEQLGARDVRALLVRAILWSAGVAAGYALFELVARQGPLSGAFGPIDALVHTRQNDVINAWNGSINYKVLYGWDPRLRSVSFEAPAFGNFCGLAWPWIWFAAASAPKHRRLRAWIVVAGFTLLMIVARSRTGLVILGAEIAALALLRGLYANRRRSSEADAALRLLLPIVALALLAGGAFYASATYTNTVAGVVSGDSVSDLSRLGFQVAAFRMFLAHPFVGVGLGQFAFHASQFLPDWAYRSPEVAPMLYYPAAPWPATYSMYARLAAELGLAGLIGWAALWLTLAASLTRLARERARAGASVGIEYPLVLTAVGILASSMTTDTFRTPMIWVALGCSSALLRARREQLRREREARAAPPQPCLR